MLNCAHLVVPLGAVNSCPIGLWLLRGGLLLADASLARRSGRLAWVGDVSGNLYNGGMYAVLYQSFVERSRV